MYSYLGRCAGWAMAIALGWGLCPARALAADLPQPKVGYAFKAYGVDQGLTNLAVVSITQDPEGFIWVGTEDGIFRYDGRRFTRFHAIEGLPSPSIRRVRAAADGWIWSDTEGGLARGSKGHFEQVSLGQGTERDTLRSAMAVDGQGGVWVGGNTGLWYGRGNAPMQRAGGLPPGPVDAIWADADGKRLLVARRGELHQRRADGTWLSRTLPKTFTLDTPQGLHLDKLGRIWLRSTNWLLRFQTFEADPVDLSNHLPAEPSQWAEVVEDAFGRIWAPTSQGIVCFEGDGTWILDQGMGLEQMICNTVMVDREGSLWVGSEGLHRLAGGMAWGMVRKKQGLPHDTVWSLCRTREGTLYMGTHQGLAEFQGSQWNLVPGTSRRTFNALTEDLKGGFWAGGSRVARAETNALLHKPKGQPFVTVPLPAIRATVGCLAVASDGSFWIGTNGEGLHHGSPGPKGLETSRVALPRESPREMIHSVQLDEAGRPVVAGTQGLAWWDGTAWQRMGKAEGLLGDHTGPMALGPNGTLWVAYWEVHGLTRLQRKGTGWAIQEHVTEPPELTSDSINSMGVDARGVLWLGTALGVRRWDGTRLRHFTHHDGLPGDDTSGNAFWCDPDGSVWFGLSAGAAHYDLHHAPPDPPAPALTLVSWKDGADHRLVPGTTPTLAYKDRLVRMEFAAAAYLQEGRFQPQVRLVGFEDQWRDSEGFQIRYTGLPPGQFRFEARVRTPDGQIGPVLSQAFIIDPPWWRTWGAYGMALALGGGILLLAVRWRTRFILRRMVELDALVQERTWNLEDANEALHKANQALEEASMVDPLTGLKNRRYLGLSLPEEIARVLRGYHQGGVPLKDHDLAFLLVDLDHFKQVNDTYGHAAGDAVLRQAASILRGVCRETDTVVRWGGEEFLIVAKAADRNQIGVIARHICDGIRAHAFEVSAGKTIHKTCSVGFTAFPVVAADPQVFLWEEAVEVADQCLYAAKNSGRDAYVGAWAGEALIASQIQARLLSELPKLVAEGLLNLDSSLPPGRALIWK